MQVESRFHLDMPQRVKMNGFYTITSPKSDLQVTDKMKSFLWVVFRQCISLSTSCGLRYGSKMTYG